MNAETDAPALNDMALYITATCPFCMRVRWALKRMGFELELRDIHRDPQNRVDLVEGGGRSMVPCLRIDHSDGRVQWMYESADIIDYLRAL